MIFLSAIHGFDGHRTVGAYDSTADAATRAFNAEHGFQQLNKLSCADVATPRGPRAIDAMDLDRFQAVASNRDRFPPGSMVMIDREGTAWRSLCPANEGSPLDVRGSFIELMLLAKRTRPDCLFGFYGMQSILPYYWIQNAFRSRRDNPSDSICQSFVARNEYAKPIVEASDFIMPNFYLFDAEYVANLQNVETRNRPYEEVVLDFVDHSLMVMQRHFPGKRIVPLLWYQNYYQYKKVLAANPGCLDNESFVWTRELLDQMFVPGPLWRAMLELITNDGVTPNYTDRTKDNFRKGCSVVATWGEGKHTPFADAPWWLETQNFFKEKRMFVVPQKVTDALALVVAADEARKSAIEVRANTIAQLDAAVDLTVAELATKKAVLIEAINATWNG